MLTIIIVAFATHHIRDGTRRGLMFAPFGDTPPLPYVMYIALTIFTPYVFKVFIDKDSFKFYSRLNASQSVFEV
jgi:hypothetical protein